MLARIAHELYWIGRQLSRAEHTARMLDGVFHADVQGRRDDPRRAALVGRAAGDHGRRAARPTADARRGRAAADARPHEPASVASCVTQAREGARTVRDVFSRGDVGGDQHVPPRPAAARQLGRAAHRPVLGLRLRQGALRPVLGRHGADDAARRGARVPRGRRADRGGRHGAADAARRAARRRGDDDDHARDGQALALLQAVGGFQAYRRAVPAPPNARPVGRFLLYERAYPTPSPPRSRRCTRRSPRPTRTTATRRRCCGSGRLQADLDFRSRALDGDDGGVTQMLGHVQQELAQVDADIAQRYFGGASPPVPRLATP